MLLAAKSNIPRSVWSWSRSQQWWHDVRNGKYGIDWWKQNLRMTEHTFAILCNEVRPYIRKKDTRFRESVSVEKRVAVTIWKLATNCEYRIISNLFGIGLSTVCVIVVETCTVIATKLLGKFVYIPQGESLREIVRGFEDCWGFPQAAGAVDGSHIPITKPLESASDYYNRKGFYSVILQGLVDFRGHFLDIYAGWPGKVHDARVFSNSALYAKGRDGKLFPDWSERMGNCNVPLVILGDPAYPLLPWLMKPYTENEHTPQSKKLFNYRQSRARMVVENAYGRLKGRWRCLLKRLDFRLENVVAVIATCVVLHNLCEKYGDHCDDEWRVDDEQPLLQVSTTQASMIVTSAASQAEEIRDAIKNKLTSE